MLYDNLLERALDGEEFVSVKEGEEWRRRRPNYRLGLGFLDRMDARPVTAEARLFARHFETVLEMIRDGADTDAWREFVEENASDELLWTLRDLFPFAEESAKNDEPEFDVWEYSEGEWRTDLPSPEDFDGEEDGEFGEADYCRTLTAHEMDIHDARLEAEKEAARDPEKLARGRETWEAFFGANRDGIAPQERDYEIKSMEGLGPNRILGSRKAAKPQRIAIRPRREASEPSPFAKNDGALRAIVDVSPFAALRLCANNKPSPACAPADRCRAA